MYISGAHGSQWEPFIYTYVILNFTHWPLVNHMLGSTIKLKREQKSALQKFMQTKSYVSKPTLPVGLRSLRCHFQSLWTAFVASASNATPAFVYINLDTCTHHQALWALNRLHVHIRTKGWHDQLADSSPETNNLTSYPWPKLIISNLLSLIMTEHYCKKGPVWGDSFWHGNKGVHNKSTQT